MVKWIKCNQTNSDIRLDRKLTLCCRAFFQMLQVQYTATGKKCLFMRPKNGFHYYFLYTLLFLSFFYRLFYPFLEKSSCAAFQQIQVFQMISPYAWRKWCNRHSVCWTLRNSEERTFFDKTNSNLNTQFIILHIFTSWHAGIIQRVSFQLWLECRAIEAISTATTSRGKNSLYYSRDKNFNIRSL
jgi:hypothetical protein